MVCLFSGVGDTKKVAYKTHSNNKGGLKGRQNNSEHESEKCVRSQIEITYTKL